MLVEDFDLVDFFAKEKGKYESSKKSYKGVGAVGVITHKQAITRWNAKELDVNGNLLLGLGSHDDNLIKIAKEVLASKEDIKTDEIPMNRSALGFLNDSITILYINSKVLGVIIELPSVIVSDQLLYLNYLSSKIKSLPKELGDIIVMTNHIAWFRPIIENNSLDIAISNATNFVNNNCVFMHPEQIIVDTSRLVTLDAKIQR